MVHADEYLEIYGRSSDVLSLGNVDVLPSNFVQRVWLFFIYALDLIHRPELTGTSSPNSAPELRLNHGLVVRTPKAFRTVESRQERLSGPIKGVLVVNDAIEPVEGDL
jgi:hypothetical protein